MEKLRCKAAPIEADYERFLVKIDFEIDKEFLEWTRTYGEAAGFVSPDRFLQFWSIDDMVVLNPYYEDIKECESLFFFASNGSNLGYAFDKTNGKIVSIDFLDIGDVEPTASGESFTDFLRLLVI